MMIIIKTQTQMVLSFQETIRRRKEKKGKNFDMTQKRGCSQSLEHWKLSPKPFVRGRKKHRRKN